MKPANERDETLPCRPVGKMVEEVLELLLPIIRKNRPLKRFRAHMLWGPPGIGKSAIVYQLKDHIEAETGKRVDIREIRLSGFTPMDLMGVPVASERLSGRDEKRFTEWLCPRIFDMDPSENVINLIFLDEINSAIPGVQAAAYQLVGDHRVGDHILPGNVIIMAAGNRMSDNGVVYRMPSPLRNRMCHYEVTADFDSWHDWAIHHRIDPRVIGYLKFARDKMNFGMQDLDEKAFPTPRTWEAVSDVLSDMEPANVSDVHTHIAAHIGVGEAINFEGWCRMGEELPNVESIFAGRSTSLPRTQDAQYALIESMTRYMEEKGEELRDTALRYACIFAMKFKADYQMMFFQNLRTIPGMTKRLMGIQTYNDWMTANSKFLQRPE